MLKTNAALLPRELTAPVTTRQAAPPRHVLFLFDQLRNLDGGAERSLLRMIQLLPPDRYRASIATFFEPPDTGFFKLFGCPIHVVPFSKSISLDALKAARRIRQIIKSENVSIVQTLFETADLWGGVVAKLSGCPVLISSRRDMGFQRTRKHQIAYRLTAPIFNCVHTVSDAVREVAIRHDGMRAENVVTIANGIPSGRIPDQIEKSLLRDRHGIARNAKVIVDIGMIKAVKGFDVLARTASLVCRDYPDAVFLVVGGDSAPEYFLQLRGLISELGLTDNFRFVGLQQNPVPFLNMADVFCHLSTTDGLSNALLEAMGTGLPCVISRVGGNPEVMEEGKNGFIVPSRDHEAAAEKLLRLLRDPALARSAGRRSWEIVEEKYTAEAMVRQFVALFDRLLSAKR